MQLVTSTNVINHSLSNIFDVDLKIGGSADKENIIRLKIADKNITFAGECNNF